MLDSVHCPLRVQSAIAASRELVQVRGTYRALSQRLEVTQAFAHWAKASATMQGSVHYRRLMHLALALAAVQGGTAQRQARAAAFRRWREAVPPSLGLRARLRVRHTQTVSELQEGRAMDVQRRRPEGRARVGPGNGTTGKRVGTAARRRLLY